MSSYATMHPAEDWAETFAHYLHIRDTLDTAAAFSFAPAAATFERKVLGPSGFDQIIDMWLPLSWSLNMINRSMGKQDLYPFVLPPAVLEKMRFIHTVVEETTAEFLGRVQVGCPRDAVDVAPKICHRSIVPCRTRYACPRGEIRYPTSRLMVRPRPLSWRTRRLNRGVSRPTRAARSGARTASLAAMSSRYCARPRRPVACRVPSLQSRADGVDVGVAELVVGGELGAFIGREEGHLDRVGVPRGPAVQVRLCGLGVGIACGTRLRRGHAMAAGVLGDGIDADGARRCPLCATRLCAGDIPAAQHKRDVSVRDSLGRVAVQQHGCDPTITRWLIAMARMSLPTIRTESHDPPSARSRSAWSSRTRRPVTWARWSGSSTAEWNSRTGAAVASRSRSDPVT